MLVEADTILSETWQRSGPLERRDWACIWTFPVLRDSVVIVVEHRRPRLLELGRELASLRCGAHANKGKQIRQQRGRNRPGPLV